MRVICASDVGRVRPNNEDNYCYGELDGAVFCAVCDGMGGVAGGEIASQIAVDTIQSQIENAYSPKMKAPAIERMLISAVTAANYKIYKYASEHSLEGMGTTVALALLKDSCLYAAYDGDSRIYIIGDDIRQITTDHTYVQELYRLGELTKEQMEMDNRKNIITRALGVTDEIEVDTLMEDLAPGAYVLLCSDGLSNCLSSRQMLEICHTQSFENTPKVLIQKANENGGQDNITVALLLNEEA